MSPGVDLDLALSPASLEWIGTRCSAFVSGARKVTGREIGRIAGALDGVPILGPQEQPTEAESKALRSLFKALRLAAPVWSAEPGIAALPALARIPGVGWGIVFARSERGHWRVETPAGKQVIYSIPPGTGFAPMRLAAIVSPHEQSAWRLLRNALLIRKGLFLKAAFASCIANFLVLWVSLYSMQVYDRVIPTQGISTLIVLTVGVILATFFEFVIKLARSRLLEVAVKTLDSELSGKVFERLLEVRMDQFPGSVGTLSAQLRNYETVRAFACSATLFTAADAPFAFLFLLVIFLLGGIKIALVPTVFLLTAFAVGMFFRRKIADHASTGMQASNRKLGLLVETVENAETVKAFGAGWQQQLRWGGLVRQSMEDDHVVRQYSEHASYFAALMQQASYVFLVAVGAWIASTSTDFTVGALIACSILSGRVLGPVGMLPNLMVQWAHARAALKSLEVVFALEGDSHGVSNPIAPDKIVGTYRLQNLEFSYRQHAGKETLQIPGLVIEAGEKVGILGPVGSGKSTLLRIFAGLYQPTRGVASLDGLDIQQISRQHLSERIAYCPQETKLFCGSLRDNLLIGLSGVSDSEILQASGKSGLCSLINAHPMGLDLPIAEGGSGVSGGQRQLIAVTRLLLTHPDVWLLDEPTAAMDEQTEARCIDVLRQKIEPEQTLLLVTHKPAILGIVDRLVVVVDGRVYLDGPRDAVLRKLMFIPRQKEPEALAKPAGALVPGPDGETAASSPRVH